MQKIDQEQLMEEFTTPHTEWSFIPSAFPYIDETPTKTAIEKVTHR